MKLRKHLIARQLPSRQRNIEGGNLCATLVQFQAVDIFVEHSNDSHFRGEVFFFHPQANQQRKGKHQKMSTPHTWVKQTNQVCCLRPSIIRPRCGKPCLARLILHESQIGPRNRRNAVAGRKRRVCAGFFFRVGMDWPKFPRPPSAQGVVEEELHHVILSKKLGDGRQLIRPDLLAGGIHLVLPL